MSVVQETTTSTQPGWVRRLWSYVLRHRRAMYISLLGAVIGSICQTAVPLAERQIVNGVIISRSSSLWPYLTLIIVLSAAGFGCSYLRRYYGGRMGLGVQYDLRNAMYEHLHEMDMESLQAMPTGQLVGRANSDSNLIQGLLMFFPMMSSNVLLMLLSLVVMLWLSPLLAVVSLVVVPAVMVLSYRMRHRLFPASWVAQQREGDTVQIVDEDLNGVRVVKAFGQEQRELERLTGSAEELYGAQMRQVRLQSLYQPVLQAMPALGQVAVLALGGWLTMHGQISLGTFLAFATYVAQLVSPAQRLANIMTIGQQARAGAERIFQLLDLKPAVVDAPDAEPLPPIEGEIAFSGVHFAYGQGDGGADVNSVSDADGDAIDDHDAGPNDHDAGADIATDGEQVLRGLDLTIHAGERIAIVGPSGCGKSTAAMMLTRTYDPQQGTVRIDGHDLRDVTLHSLRSQVGYAFEDSFLFSESIRENIAYGRPDASLDEIRAAATAAGADTFIEELPDGYETTVGERGLSLSGGQRQRVALARTLLYDPRILILDDATSAVDATTEGTIHEALRELMEGRTTILIAHRRSTLRLASRIVVMDQGQVVDEGDHEELMERSALYRTYLGGLEESELAAVGDRIEALAAIEDGQTTAAAWVKESGDGKASTSTASRFGPPSLGMGLGRGGGGGGFRSNLSATPQLLAGVAKLPPISDHVHVDLAREARQDRHFSLRRLLFEFWRPLSLGLLLVVLDALASVIEPVLVKHGIDGGVQTGSESVLFVASGIYLVVVLADLFNEIGDTFVTGRAAQRIMLSLRVRIWAQLQRLSLDYYEGEMAGRIMTRMTTDVDQFESLIENGVLSALVSLVTFVGVGVALLAINLKLGLCTLSVVVPLAFATVAFRRRAVILYNAARDRIAIVNADFQESLSGVREAQAFVHEERSNQHFRRLGRDYLGSRVAAQRLVGIYFPFVQFLSGIAGAIVLGVGAVLIHDHQLTAGALIAFVLYIDLFFSPIQQLSQVFDAWQQTAISVQRIGELMRTETLTPEAAEPLRGHRLSGDLAFNDVRFSYPESNSRLTALRRGPRDPRLPQLATATRRPPQALRGIELELAPGETVALVGETGAGKSTLAKLVARFYDASEGSVSADGVDVRDFDLHEYRSQLGYVPQESFLFTGTIRDNIAYGRPQATDAEVEAAARAVGAHDFIATLPGGYLHTLTERGSSLSAGQRQLLALARAELVEPEILILDEATSNLDLVTEAHVTAALEQLTRGRTTIVIAHRLQTARGADRIVVLSAGQIVEIGTHEELLARDGRYASMWQAFATEAA